MKAQSRQLVGSTRGPGAVHCAPNGCGIFGTISGNSAAAGQVEFRVRLFSVQWSPSGCSGERAPWRRHCEGKQGRRRQQKNEPKRPAKSRQRSAGSKPARKNRARNPAKRASRQRLRDRARRSGWSRKQKRRPQPKRRDRSRRRREPGPLDGLHRRSRRRQHRRQPYREISLRKRRRGSICRMSLLRCQSMPHGSLRLRRRLRVA